MKLLADCFDPWEGVEVERAASPSRWDFFISYTQADRAWAEWIAWLLEEDGNRVLVQAWDFVPGTNWVHGMQDGVATAARTIALLSTNYLESVYGGAEWQTAWATDPRGRERRLLTVRVDDCERPGLLAAMVGVDVFDVPEATVRARLRAMVSGAVTGRAKPDKPPPFPLAGRAIPRKARFPGALPRVWNVPARAPHFVGRDAVLDRLAAVLQLGSRTVTVRGMNGVGKSRLANEYVHRTANRYDVVWWIQAGEPASIADEFARLAEELGVGADGDPASVHRALADAAGWFLIFDGADRAADLIRWLPATPVVPGTAGHVLVTTPRSGFSRLGPVVDLDVVDRDEAVALLRAGVPDISADVAAGIAAELGRLPFALEQAAAYLDRSALAAAEYLRILRSPMRELLLSRGRPAGRDETIASLWNTAFARIEVECPPAAQLLGICSYLAPEPVPLDLFTDHPDLLPDPLATAVRDGLEFGEVVGVVIDHSVAQSSGSELRLHRLVQAALRRRHRDQAAVAEAGLGGRPESPWVVALRVLRAHIPPPATTRPEDGTRWSVLLPHVLAATSWNLDARGDTAQEDCAWLLDRAGTHLRVEGHLAEARPLLERALDLAEAVHGPDDPAVALGLSNLARVLRDLGEPAAALPLLERALTINEAAHGPDHRTVALSLGNLALVLWKLGDAAAARPLLERALAVDEAVHGADHPDVAVALGNLAAVLERLGEPAAARPLLERALEIGEAAYGPDHPTVALLRSNLDAILDVLRN